MMDRRGTFEKKENCQHERVKVCKGPKEVEYLVSLSKITDRYVIHLKNNPRLVYTAITEGRLYTV